jgi:hypothetical protein
VPNGPFNLTMRFYGPAPSVLEFPPGLR